MKAKIRSCCATILSAVVCMAFLAGCSDMKLSKDFNEEEVRSAAENVIDLINNQDSEGLRAICNMQVRDALTDEVLAQIYEAISEGGSFEQIKEMSVAGKKDPSSEEEFAVVVVRAKYEIKTFTYTISFTKQMKLAGLFYK
jgi:hypothetical protein